MLPPLLTLLALAVAPSHGPAVPQDLPEPAATQDRPELRFVDLDEARARAAVDGRPIALVFRAIWCGACAELEQDTLPSRLVQDRGDDAHWVLVDVDRQQALSHDYGVDSTPHLVIEAADGALLGRARGYLTPQELVLLYIILEIGVCHGEPPPPPPPVE